MESEKTKRNVTRNRRKMRVGKRVRSTPQRYRLSVRRSNRHIYAQLIDDEKLIVVAGCGTSSKVFQEKNPKTKSKEAARIIGESVAEHAKKHGVTSVVFDRGRWKYHGLIAQLADAAREKGLKF